MPIKVTFTLTEQQKADLQAFAEYMDKYCKSAVFQAEVHLMLHDMQQDLYTRLLSTPPYTNTGKPHGKPDTD